MIDLELSYHFVPHSLVEMVIFKHDITHSMLYLNHCSLLHVMLNLRLVKSLLQLLYHHIYTNLRSM